MSTQDHNWIQDGYDKIGNAIEHCTSCGIRKIENCSTFWQVTKGRKWTDEESSEVPPCHNGKPQP